jgi:condensin complex subunit 3
VPVIHAMLRVADELEEDDDMISPSQIALQLVDWTDPRRLVDLSKVSKDLELSEEETTPKNLSIHIDLAIAIMMQMKKGSSKDPLVWIPGRHILLIARL